MNPCVNTYQNESSDWLEQELEGSKLCDKRNRSRMLIVMKQLWKALGTPIPFACQDWAGTKAAYRFLSNPMVSEHDILKGHFHSTKSRLSAIKGPILFLQDTTEFSFKRKHQELIGLTHKSFCGKDKLQRSRLKVIGGIYMHSSLAITPEGLPLGLTSAKLWTRKEFKGTNQLKKRVNPTRIPIEKKESIKWIENLRQSIALIEEPERCVFIGDRENDIYEFFCSAHDVGCQFLVRTCVDRLAGEGEHTVADEMEETKVKGKHKIEFIGKDGKLNKAILELKYKRIKILPPIGKHKKYYPLHLTVIHAEEKGKPKGRKRILWKLLTNVPVSKRSQVVEKIRWYAMRWKIEVFHKILKSGCKVEESKLRTAQRVANLIAIYCILSWRLFWMTMLNRESKNINPKLCFSQSEIEILDQMIPAHHKRKTLSDYIEGLAKLGGYLARKSDPPPGNTVLWRGLNRLVDIQVGFKLALEIVGN